MGIDFRGYRIESAPPPANGAAMFMTALKVLEEETFGGGPLRTAANLDRLGRVWRVVEPEAYRLIGDTKGSRHEFERLVAPASVRGLRRKAFAQLPVRAAAAADLRDETVAENPMAATTHFIVIDNHGNVVCATQSLSTHFGAGVVPPGTGVVLNNSMSNFDFKDPKNPNYLAPGHRPRSTLSPTLVLLRGQPVLALGVPGAARIPTAMLQVLLDNLALHRRVGESIGDTRFHFMVPWKPGDVDTFEAEQSFPTATARPLRALGWKIDLSEPAGRGRHFGGVNAVELTPDGLLTGYADPRRTNAAVGLLSLPFTEGAGFSVFDRSFHAKDQKVRRQALQAYRHGQADAPHAWLPSPAAAKSTKSKAPSLRDKASRRGPCHPPPLLRCLPHG